ncbi:MAG: SDR family oxidoreductase [Ardenticatenales bacterium]|nr:SDR family oxidoreductase [Ardenticatenales bacterium]
MKRVLIVGATSAMAHEAAKHFASDGDKLFLVGRSADKLQSIVDDLKVRGAAQVESALLDLTEMDRHAELLENAQRTLGGLDILLIAYGITPVHEEVERSVEKMLDTFTTNALSVIALLTVAAPLFEQQKQGTIAVISSVAGDRGRQSNYVYGAAKAALSTYLEGMRSRLYKSGVTVVTIKPGLVDTPMTAHLKKGPLFASAARAGEDIYKAIIKGKDTAYVPFFWMPIMTVIKLIPEAIFKRLNLSA